VNSLGHSVVDEFGTQGDTGRRYFSTGAQRHASEGKGRFDLIPPEALLRLAKRYEHGAKKFGARNWERGIPQTLLLDSAFRHLAQYMAYGGDGVCQAEDHLAAAAWNIFAAMTQEDRVEHNRLPASLLGGVWNAEQ
jgi:hypothetical protein